MRRLLAALLASVMLAGVAPAAFGRVAIVTPIQNTGSPAGQASESNQAIARDTRLLMENLAAMGADFDSIAIVSARNMKTEWMRTGLMRWPDGTTEQFSGIIIPTYNGNYRTAATTNIYPNVSFDSLTRVARGGVLVPHLYLLTNSTGLRTGTNDYLSSATAATRCSVGVAEGASKTNPSLLQSIYMTERPSVRWQAHTYTAGWPVGGMTVPGGVRKLLQMSASGYGIIRDGDGLAESQWPDSLPFYSADNETTLVWDRLWADIASCPDAKTMTFADYYGGGITYDSLSNEGVLVTYRTADNEGDLSVLRFALAHFDSLLGNTIFKREPAVRGIFVANANGRGIRRWTGGIQPQDTLAYYSSLDSLAAWGVPVTFGLNVNPDTLSAYSRDLIKLKSVPQARFTPYITDGVMDTAFASIGATGTTRNKERWVDVFGRWRDRVFVGSGGIGDTSLVTQLSYLRTFTDSVTQRPTVRLLCPPYDDWSPGVKSATNRFIAKRNSRAYADSFMYAAQAAGWLGVLANGQSPECNLSVSSGPGYTNPRGFIGRQGWYKPGIMSDPFLVLTHSGSTMGMGKTQQILWSDSTSAKSAGSWQYLHYTLDRANGQFFAARWRNQDDWKDYGSDYNANANFLSDYVNVMLPMDDFQYGVWRGHVLKLYASDLSGLCCNPARTGLHVIRSLQQSFYATNLAAGRTLLRLGYLDEVRP